MFPLNSKYVTYLAVNISQISMKSKTDTNLRGVVSNREYWIITGFAPHKAQSTKNEILENWRHILHPSDTSVL